MAKSSEEQVTTEADGVLEAAVALNLEYEGLLQSAPPMEELKAYVVSELSAASQIPVVESEATGLSPNRAVLALAAQPTLQLQQQLIQAATAQANGYGVRSNEDVYQQVNPPELEGVEFWSSNEAFAVTKNDDLVAYGFRQGENLKVLPLEYLKETWSQLEASESPSLNLLKGLRSQIPHLKLAQVESVSTTLIQIQQQQLNPTLTYIDADVLKQLPAQPEVALSNGNALKVLQNALQKWNPSQEETKQWVSGLAQEAQRQYETTKEIVDKIAQTTHKSWQKGQKLSRQLQSALESEEVQQFIQQIKDRTSEGVVSLGNWIASRPEAIATHRLMRESFDKFNQGHDRTLESSYSAGDYQISNRGQNLYTLSQGDRMLMQFTVGKNVLGQDTFQIKGKAVDFEASGVLKQLRRKELEVTGSPEAATEFESLKQQLFDKLLRLKDGTHQSGNYTLSKQGETYEVANGREALDPQNLTLAQVKRLSESTNSAYGQQQVDACMPVLAKHLQLQGRYRDETDKRVVDFNPESKTLSYQNKLEPEEFLMARWLVRGNGGIREEN